jgi:hypothetical protein
LFQQPVYRLLREGVAVLDAVEAFLLAEPGKPAVQHQRGG